MKKYIVLFILCLVSLCSMNAQAATGSIEIQLQESSDDKILYSKVATMVDGLWKLEDNYQASNIDLNALENAEELEAAAKKLYIYIEDEKMISTEGKNKILLEDLEEGVYLIASAGNADKEMLPALVAVPGWTGEEMTYNVTVIPKYGKKVQTPDTGWNSREGLYIGMFLISLIIIMGLSCHNRFKCGKIPLNYSEMGGYTNGNDNDTKNPRCPCRIRQRGSRSVN